MKEKVTFGDIYTVIFQEEDSNKECIIVYNDEKRIVYNKKQYRILINKMSRFLKLLYPYIKVGDWIGLKYRNNYLYYAVVFGAMKLGWNILLLGNKSESNNRYRYEIDVELIAILDNNILDNFNDEAIDVQCLNSKFEKDIWSSKVAFLSSGTTGKPQVIIYHAYAILNQIKNVKHEFLKNETLADIVYKTDNSHRKIVTFLPMNHILGFLLPLVFITLDLKVVFLSDQTPYGIIKGIRNENALGSFGVPMVWKLIKNILKRRYSQNREGVDKLLGENFKIILSGGSKTDSSIRNSYIRAGIEFFVGYGLTETGFLSIGKSNLNDCESEGKVYDNYEIKVLTSDGNIRNEGTGEIIVKSDAIYTASIKDKKEICPELIEGMYYRTGDIFELKNRELFFKGRMKNIIVDESGENIYAEELEEFFKDMKSKGIVYFISEYRNRATMFIDRNTHKRISKEYIIELIREKNKNLPISKKILKVLFLNINIEFTQKGDPIRILKEYRDIGEVFNIKGV
ncbi:AMP-binding protein [Clostridium botulinum]|uniref:AMP-binding protein n=1 Tax=Clostridium botulinum TaxID=1491 RepID=UPI00016BA9F4|nr:class I adenylate-forming enzyme family protein [Clostridium botulinum]APC85828.1 AMP-binding enzyme family protein [Clostridium botulinum]AXG94250.1 long-chain fatty acid--CoA ligase [Clostridium botulinum]EDT80404.1 putative acyl-CoA synthetase [Clostridium botulinum NCTC 2916]MBY6771337.1 acyl--CoA ligase [Clostridium botulinum]MBY6775029.1 acyl--CoA ligase [Clostridium botulinum]